MVQHEIDVGPEVVAAVSDAIDFWNIEVGEVVFEDFGELLESVADVVVEVSNEDTPAGDTALHFAPHCLVLTASLLLSGQLSSAELKRTAIHELGHVLGLLDDNDPRSVMNWQLVAGIQHVPETELIELRAIAASTQSSVVGVE